MQHQHECRAQEVPHSSGNSLSSAHLPPVPPFGTHPDQPPVDSRAPFRRPPVDLAAAEGRQARIEHVSESINKISLSKRSELYRFDVVLDSLPSEFSGFTILHLSDIHFHTQSPRRTEEFSCLLQYLQACGQAIDLVCITGDIVTNDAADLSDQALDLLSSLSAKTPTVFVMGNHDYYGDTDHLLRSRLNQAGLVELRNDWLEISRNGRSIGIFGTDDALMGKPRPPEPKDNQIDRVNLLLTHNLDALDDRYPDIFDISLSGHLHAGEFAIHKFNGVALMEFLGHSENLNKQIVGWDALTDRCLSYISPGQARHYLNFNTTRPGGSILRLLTSKGD